MHSIRPADNCLVLHDGALGDVLLSLPLLRHLRLRHDRLCIACRPDIGALLCASGVSDETIDIGSSLFLPLHGALPDPRLSDFLGRFQHAMIFSVRECPGSIAMLRQTIQNTSHIHTIPDRERVHATSYRLGQYNLQLHAADHLLEIPASRTEQVREYLRNKGVDVTRRLITMHPGSGSAGKNWPAERFFGLARTLLEQYSCHAVFLSGPAEDDAMLNTINACIQGSRAPIVHLHNRSLIEVAGVLAHSSLHIGNDSGITHLAASLGIPVIALFLNTDAAVWAPLGSTSHVLHMQDSRDYHEDSEQAAGDVYRLARRILDSNSPAAISQ